MDRIIWTNKWKLNPPVFSYYEKDYKGKEPDNPIENIELFDENNSFKILSDIRIPFNLYFCIHDFEDLCYILDKVYAKPGYLSFSIKALSKCNYEILIEINKLEENKYKIKILYFLPCNSSKETKKVLSKIEIEKFLEAFPFNDYIEVYPFLLPFKKSII